MPVYDTSLLAAGVADVAAEDPGLLLVMLILLVGFMVAVVAGIFLLLVVAAVCGGMLLFGMASVSVLVSWYHRSIARGLGMFIRMLFAVIGIAGGMVTAWLLHRFIASHFSLWLLLLISVCAGLAGGLVTANGCLYLLKRLYHRFFKTDREA